MGIAQGAGDVGAQMRQGMAGDLAFTNFRDETVSATNRAPEVQQVGTCVITTATALEAYALVINGVTVTYTADSSTDTTEVAAGLAAAINHEPLVRGKVTATSSTATITVTANWAGVSFTMTEGANAAKMTTTEAATAAVAASAVEFGRLVVGDSISTTRGEQYGRVCDSTALAAQVDTLTVIYAASEVYNVVIQVEGGDSFIAETTAATDDATTATNLATAINNRAPAYTVIAAATTGGALTVTSTVAGKAFKIGIGAKTTAGRLTLAHTTATANTDVNRVALGVSIRQSSQEASSLSSTTGNYAANSVMKLLAKGSIFVLSTEAITQYDKVWVETAAGSTAGRFYNSTSATRVLLTGAKWHRDTSTGDLGIVTVAFSS